MTNEFGKILNLGVMAVIKVLSWNLPTGAEENNKKLQSRIASFLAEIQTEHLPNRCL
jgi:hypothetical protein